MACSNCRATDHRITDCPQQGAECSKCGKKHSKEKKCDATEAPSETTRKPTASQTLRPPERAKSTTLSNTDDASVATNVDDTSIDDNMNDNASSKRPRSAAAAIQEATMVIDITRGLLQINERVLQNLARFLPASETSTITSVRQHFSRLIDKLDTEPDTVLAATQDDRMESLLKKYGPGDPFSSLPYLSENDLKPGDILLRCSPALSSQMTELMIWSPYTHSALYIGNGMIIDSTWQHGVQTRNLADLLSESNRVGVLRMDELTFDQMNQVIAAAQAQEPAEYNFEGVKTLGMQKLDALTNMSPQSLGNLLGNLGRAEHLAPDATDSGKYACSELIAVAFKAVGITLSHANGFTPGDMVRLSQAGLLLAMGRLQVSAK
jgi:hypothetical protein